MTGFLLIGVNPFGCVASIKTVDKDVSHCPQSLLLLPSWEAAARAPIVAGRHAHQRDENATASRAVHDCRGSSGNSGRSIAHLDVISTSAVMLL